MIEYIFPLSFAQERLWFVHELHPDSPTYNIAMVLRLRGEFDEPAMRAALNDVVARHDALRTYFSVIDGTPRQVVRDSWPIGFEVDDLRAMPATERASEVDRRVDAFRYTPFDIAHDRLIRASAMRETDDETVMLLALHHIVCDGWAQDVLLRELAGSYRAAIEGHSADLPEPEIQYPDFAVWQRERVEEGADRAALDYWCDKLAGAVSSELPGDFARGQADPVAGARHTFVIPAEVVDRLKPMLAQEQATTFMMLLAGLDMLLARLTGTDDVLIGTSVAGRTRPELDSVIGCFLNTLVLRTDLSGDPTFREVLRRARDTALGALEHQDPPFEQVVAALEVPRDMSRAPLFQVMFVYQNVPSDDVTLPGLDGTLELLTNETSKFDILLDAYADPQGIVCRLEYLAGLFEPRTMELFGSQLIRLLVAVAKDPDRRLSQLELVDPMEPEAWSETHTPVGRLLELQTRRRPDAPAIRTPERTTTYAEVFTAAQEFADRLHERDLRPGEPVPLTAETLEDRAAGLFGILMAGGSLALPELFTGDHAAAAVHWLREALSDEELSAMAAGDLLELLGPLCWGGTVHIEGNTQPAVALAMVPKLGAPIPDVSARRRIAVYTPAGLPCAIVASDGLSALPIEGVEIRLLDGAGHPVPVRRPGIVHIGGVPVDDLCRWRDDGALVPGLSVGPETGSHGADGTDAADAADDDEVLERVVTVWREVLGLDQVSPDVNFFDLGGHSLAMVRVQAALAKEFDRRLPLLQLFAHPTARSLARMIGSRDVEAAATVATIEPVEPVEGFPPLAVIGMACLFPGAAGTDEFWRNLLDGVDSTQELTDDELRAAGLTEEEFHAGNYVRRIGLVRGGDLFDAGYFGMSGREAELVDPQQRFFLETAHDALQDAGYDIEQFSGRIGLFGGTGLNLYGWLNVALNPAKSELTHLQGLLAVEKDHAATRAAYKLNLRGPALSVQTACSTSLVAVCTAAKALAMGECDIAVAGGTNMTANPSGYHYTPGGITSPDGRCRAFDADSGGTTPGMGSGFVVLRPLRDAVAAGDTVHAVIIGAATNNDGSDKVGYTAPSISGQEAVLRAAHRTARIDPRSIGYVEAHGTGTALGDPIELSALNRAFGDMKVNCAIGSVKSNIGHLDAAAGVAGFIKATLIVRNGVIPPSLHYRAPNPEIEFGGFRVNTEITPWPAGYERRRAGVSAFGVGGTNAHVVLEEAPAIAPSDPPGSSELIVLSADGEESLRKSADRLAAHLDAHRDLNLADVAFTLQVGRRARPLRLALEARDVADAVTALRSWDLTRLRIRRTGPGCPTVREGDVAEAWLAGASIAWSGLHVGKRRRRIPLPTYAFDKRRYFVEIEQPGVDEHRRDTVYLPTWTRVLGDNPRQGTHCFVIHDGSALAEELVAGLSAIGARVVPLGVDDDLMASVRALRAEATAPTTIVHCVGSDVEDLTGYRSLLALARTLATEHVAEEVVVITDAGQAVAGERALNPFAAMQRALAVVMQQELFGLTCRTIDVATCVDTVPVAAHRAAAEALSPAVGPLVALRGSDRWVPHYAPLRLPEPPERTTLREHGTFLVLGAGGVIGRAIARRLARRARARLVLVQRSAWTDEAFLTELTDCGAEVMTARADITDVVALREVTAAAEKRFGAVHGVVNTAGVVHEDYAMLLPDLDDEVCDRNFRAKLAVTDALWQVFGDHELDFCVLASSVSAVLGGLGYGAYAASNAYVDTFVERARRGRPNRWMAIDWDAWRNETAEAGSPLGISLERHALTSEEGGDLFERMVTGEPPARLVTSTTDLHARLEDWVNSVAERPETSSRRYPRPELKTAFVAPRTAVESLLVEIWSEILGLERVGVFDDFFDLGGDSLLALHLVDGMEARFGRSVPLEAVLTSTTIERLAELISQGSEGSSVVVPLGGDGAASLFLIHPLAGTVLCYRGLGERLGVTLFGVQSPGLVEDPEQPLSFMDLVERYHAEIKSVQSEGPYLVGGYSMGGGLAFEVARRLVDGGDEVAWVGSIDGYPPQRGSAFFDNAELMAESMRELLTGVGITADPATMTSLPPEVDSGRFADRVDVVAEWMRGHRLLSPNADVRRRARLLLVGVDNRNAYHRWQPGEFGSRMNVYATSESAEVIGADTLGWQRFARAEGQVITGSHERLLTEPMLTELVGRLRRDVAAPR
ncbi:SDR family NAD(P)-dependent oxidoreductase [Nonomuraea sp. K274]|uniref:SDR family NAD(P)-dependent oxidoreductase n=1 Tax=Nonomuraea cypriaca TaxID=1187855 RepID=A0A931F150_9ACTN|nr:SDR family NAD(P)-dependent oxidoreductase [Nonomuraea cypriaca]MBF8187073.1 SDR family NAD(P)-dependent oxidoreductase [Nonomuraea cypriaca]